VPVYDVKDDDNAVRAWAAYEAAGRKSSMDESKFAGLKDLKNQKWHAS